MDKDKTTEIIEAIRSAVHQVPHLRTLNYDNQRFNIWRNKTKRILKAAFGGNSDEYTDFVQVEESNKDYFAGWQLQDQYIDNLDSYEAILEPILQTYKITGIPAAPITVVVPSRTGEITVQPPSAFIAHGGETPARNTLCEFLDALKVAAIIVEKEPSEGRSINEQVDWCLNKSDCAIILATKGDIDSKTGNWIPRGNILIEVGKVQERFPQKIIYLLEEGATFPTDVSEKVWERFTHECMDKAFIKIARELNKFGLLLATKS